MILCSRLEEKEITVPIEEEEKIIYLQLAKMRAKEILLKSNYRYIIYGRIEGNILYLISELTNIKPQKEEVFLTKGDLQ